MTDARANDIRTRLSALAAAPKTHEAVVTFSDGSAHRVPCSSELAAQNYADGYDRFTGTHEYISRATDQSVTIVSCEVVAL